MRGGEDRASGGLRFRTLGSFEAYRGDERIPARAFGTRHALTFLKILVAERGRAVPTERLVETLWPESDPRAGRHSLQVAVAAVRGALEPGLRSGAASRYIATERGGYRLIDEGLRVDMDVFTRLVGDAKRAEREGDDAAATDAYRGAVGMYDGDYLADEEAAGWAIATRERVRESYLDASLRLARILTRGGASDESVAVLERALSFDPLREDLYRQLMQSHLAAGRRSHALAVFERCVRTLRAELGVEPSAATRALLDEPETADTQSRPRVGDLRLPFVGRDAELGRLASAWDRSARESGVVAIVEAEAGEGKTRLVRRLAAVLGGQVRTLWLVGHESERDVAYAPLRALLGSWLERASSAVLVPRLGYHAGVLAQLVPAIRDAWPEAPRPDERVDDTAIAEGFTRALSLMKGPGRALVVLDDIHWMDDGTVRWLPQAPRREIPGLLVVVTRRPSEDGPPSLAAVLGDLQRRGSTTVRLRPLSRDDLELLAAPVAGRDARALASRLHQATAGNALFVVETLHVLWQRGPIETDVEDVPIAPTLRDALAARLVRLPASARDTLAAIAVVDAPASPALIAATAALSTDDTLAALEVLLRAQLARPSDDGRQYLAEHPLIARATYGAIPLPRRRELHLRAASALEHAPVARIRHLALADVPAERLISEAEAAGTAAVAAGRPTDALACLERAYGLVRPSGSGIDRRVRIAEGLAETLLSLGRSAEAEARCREVLHEVSDPLVRSRLRRRIALSHGEVQGGYDTALALLDDAAADLDGKDVDDAIALELGRVEAARSTVHTFRSDLPAARVHGERALEFLRRDPAARRDVARVLARLGLVDQRTGRLASAESRYREASAEAGATGDALLEADVNGSLGAALIHRGRPRDAREILRGVVEVHRRSAATKHEAIALANLGWCELETGDLGASVEAYDRSIALAESIGAPYTVSHSLVGVGETLVRLGRYARARSDLERGIALAERIGSPRRAGHGYIYLAQLALAEDDPAAALALLARAAEIGERLGDAHTAREGGPVRARARLALGDAAGGVAAARAALEGSVATGFVLSEGRARVALGECLIGLGDQAAGAELERAVTLFRAGGARHELALALHAQAQTLRGRRAADVFDEAASLARECGATPLVRRIEEAHRQTAATV